MDAAPAHPVEIRAEALTKDFGGRVVLDRIDLEIRAGEIVCIVGASGSGKTVLLSHLIGLMAPTAGRVLAADHNEPGPGGAPPLRALGDLSPDGLDLVRLHWAVVFQRNALFSGTVRDNVALWLREHTTLGAAEIDRRVVESVGAAALDVADVLDKDRDALSGGMAKRVAIARAIAADPLVLFYDEPTTGLDPIIGAQIHDLIWSTHHRPVGGGFGLKDLGDRRPPRRAGDSRTTIVVTHDKDLLRRVAPRVVMLDKSRVVFDGPYGSFQASGEPAARAYLAEMPALHARDGW